MANVTVRHVLSREWRALGQGGMFFTRDPHNTPFELAFGNDLTVDENFVPHLMGPQYDSYNGNRFLFARAAPGYETCTLIVTPDAVAAESPSE